MWGFEIRSISFCRLNKPPEMYLIAPAVLCVGLSFALYGTVDIWPLDMYKMQKHGISPVVAQDVGQLKAAVKAKQISPPQAESAFQQK